MTAEKRPAPSTASQNIPTDLGPILDDGDAAGYRRASAKVYKRIGKLASIADAAEVEKLAAALAKMRWGANGVTDQRVSREAPLRKPAGFVRDGDS